MPGLFHLGLTSLFQACLFRVLFYFSLLLGIHPLLTLSRSLRCTFNALIFPQITGKFTPTSSPTYSTALTLPLLFQPYFAPWDSKTTGKRISLYASDVDLLASLPT